MLATTLPKDPVEVAFEPLICPSNSNPLLKEPLIREAICFELEIKPSELGIPIKPEISDIDIEEPNSYFPNEPVDVDDPLTVPSTKNPLVKLPLTREAI